MAKRDCVPIKPTPTLRTDAEGQGIPLVHSVPLSGSHVN